MKTKGVSGFNCPLIQWNMEMFQSELGYADLKSPRLIFYDINFTIWLFNIISHGKIHHV